MSVANVALTSPTREEFATFPGCCFKGRSNYSSDESSSSFAIFLTLAAGSVIPVQLLESESIASLKLRRTRNQKFSSNNDKKVRIAGDRNKLVSSENVARLVRHLHEFLTVFARTSCGKEFEFFIERFRNIAYLKQQIAIRGKGLFTLEDQELLCNGEKLNEDYRLVHDVSKGDNVIKLLVKNRANVRAEPIVEANSNGRRRIGGGVKERENRSKELQYVVNGTSNFNLQANYVNHDIDLPAFAEDLISVTLEGLHRGHSPVLASEGMGGTYLMPDSSGRKYVSVFKPLDEEPMAANNPRGQPLSTNGEGLKRGTKVGEGALREAAAYGLDHPRHGPRFLQRQEKGFAGVPVSLMVQCSHEGFNNPDGYEGTQKYIKVGSLQKFVKNCGSCEDFGPNAFPVEEVHKISVLDIRLANTDRHAGNILMSYGEDGKIVLIPIDHGYCLPDNFEDCTFEWLNWPQAHKPFSSDTIDYIKTLDAEDDIKQIALCGWDLSPQCARTFRISTMLLKKGAERDLTSYAIGSIMCRETLNKESAIEEIVREAQDAVLPGRTEDAFIKAVSRIMDSRLDKLMK